MCLTAKKQGKSAFMLRRSFCVNVMYFFYVETKIGTLGYRHLIPGTRYVDWPGRKRHEGDAMLVAPLVGVQCVHAMDT